MALNLSSGFRRLRNRTKPGCLVLCYHRVSERTDDFWRNAVSPSDFDAHMTHLAQRYAVVSIDEIVDAIDAHRPLAPRSVAVTFDDGYASNVAHALPALKKHGVPATFYLNTAWFERQRFWFDDLGHAAALPETSGALTFLCNACGVDAPASRPAAVAVLRDRLKTMDDAEREQALQAFRHAYPDASPDLRPMTRSDARDLARSGFTVGAHTHTHPSLGALSEERQRHEIRENKRILESVTGASISHFAYPFGGPDDFNAVSIVEVKAAGFRSAATTMSVPLRWPADRYRIPRLSVKNWPVAKFEAELRDAWSS